MTFQQKERIRYLREFHPKVHVQGGDRATVTVYTRFKHLTPRVYDLDALGFLTLRRVNK